MKEAFPCIQLNKSKQIARSLLYIDCKVRKVMVGMVLTQQGLKFMKIEFRKFVFLVE